MKQPRGRLPRFMQLCYTVLNCVIVTSHNRVMHASAMDGLRRMRRTYCICGDSNFIYDIIDFSIVWM